MDRESINRMFTRRRLQRLAGLLSLALVAGCHTDMWIQPKAKPLQQSDFFADGAASRPPVANTVAQGQLRTDDHLYTGIVAKKYVDEFPFAIAKQDIERGQDRFNIYCSPCHGALGDGKGMIAQRGLALRAQPATYHTERLRKMPVGYFFDVITHGHGAMFSYAQRVDPDDRWKIVSYIRALQLSQHSALEDLTAEEQGQIDEKPVGIGIAAAAGDTHAGTNGAAAGGHTEGGSKH